MSKLKSFEVKLQYTGTLTYIVKAADVRQAKRKGRRLYDTGAEPTQLMTDWERVDKLDVTPL